MNEFSLPNNEGYRDTDDEYQEPYQVKSFCKLLTEAWMCVPEESFGSFLNVALNGYEPSRLSYDEAVEILQEFILQNQ